ncbi:hypothetical protein NM74_11770 [Aeromonas hydrophila]|jgi:hypothetical protein|uniref:DUF7281 domain-containing protein n=1 Tax=Aeromonas hydrophila TaxID=644 RepID=UPI0005387C72|nr:hypothetical protein [Aeromonas hydrophila]KHA56409.1 hypothetical protein NM74_11770 [Aeromonas hydrophila]
MSRSLISALRKLRQAPEGRLANSQLSEGQRRELTSFAQATGSIQSRRLGGGVVFEVSLPEVVEQQWRLLVPVEVFEPTGDLPIRARNIASTRSSKGSEHRHEIGYLLLKAGPGQVDWRDEKGHLLDLRASTDQFGAAALAIYTGSTWQTEHPLWLIENQALFDRLDWLPSSGSASIAYYSGQLSNTLINWLAEYQRAPEIVFFPDYDGVGLLNYARIRAKVGSRVSFWLMPNWSERLARFGCPSLWQDTQREFTVMQKHPVATCFTPELMALIRQMQRQGLALEQETVWLQQQPVG